MTFSLRLTLQFFLWVIFTEATILKEGFQHHFHYLVLPATRYRKKPFHKSYLDAGKYTGTVKRQRVHCQ